MPQEIARMHDHPIGEFKFEDQLTTSVSPSPPAKLGEFRAEIELRNSG